MSRDAWIGIDPGLSGALALFLPAVDLLPVDVRVEDMPRQDDGELDNYGLREIIGAWKKECNVLGAAIEKVHAIPNYTRRDGSRQGISSSASFAFGDAFGAVKQAVASAGVRYTLIPPATWKTLYRLKGGKENKHMSRTLAAKMFPAQATLFKRVKDDGRAEAALLAHYGSRLRSA